MKRIHGCFFKSFSFMHSAAKNLAYPCSMELLMDSWWAIMANCFHITWWLSTQTPPSRDQLLYCNHICAEQHLTQLYNMDTQRTGGHAWSSSEFQHSKQSALIFLPMRIYLTHRKVGDITGSRDEIGPNTSFYQSTLLPPSSYQLPCSGWKKPTCTCFLQHTVIRWRIRLNDSAYGT